MSAKGSPTSLRDWAERLADQAKRSAEHRANEEELRLDLSPLVVEAAKSMYGADPLHTTAERPGKRGVKRRYDNLYGGVVVEWEWDMGPARREHGAQQALDYLDDIRSQVGLDEAFTAVVCDGKQWGFLNVDPAQEFTLFDPLPSTAASHFEWRVNDPAATRRFLELLSTHRKRPISADAIRNAFGADADTTRSLILLLTEALVGRSLEDRTDVLYREWRRALDVVYGDLDAKHGQTVDIVVGSYGLRPDRAVGEYLFVLHTYFALVTRFFAIELLAIATDDHEHRPSSWLTLPDKSLLARLRGLEAGDLPGGLRVGNLFESDVFGWWLPSAEGNADILEQLRQLLSKLQEFAFPRAVLGPQRATDVLSDLYQSLVPRQMRKRLGEFLTPRWLAGACLQRLRDLGAPLGKGRVIDPTCGTGTFLVPILTERLAALQRERDPGEDLTSSAVQKVLDSVVGIDINPVAVAAARANYVLALGSLAERETLSLPIWRADSLLVPDAPPREGTLEDGPLIGHDFLELHTSLEKPFRIPPLLARADRLAALQGFLDDGLGMASQLEAEEDLTEKLDAQFGVNGLTPATDSDTAWRNDRDVALALLDQLWVLTRADKDGIWAKIIANSYAPLFAGRFDIVVGNPPWLGWGKLPEAWRKGSEKLWRRYGLWQLPTEPGDRGGIMQVSDLAQLVYAVSLDRYAADDGIVGLLTPLSLLIGNPGGRAFRQFRLKSEPGHDGDAVDIPFAVMGVDDWSGIQPFAPVAANKPVFIVSKRGAVNSFPVEGQRWERASTARIHGDWISAARALKRNLGTYRPANPNATTSAWSFTPTGAPPLLTGGANEWHFGKGLDTRGANGVFFVRIVKTASGLGRVTVENLPDEGRNPTVPVRRGVVESALVYPLLRGRDVSAWHAEPSCFIVAPHSPSDFEEVLSEASLSHGGTYSYAGAWLRQFREILIARRTPPTRKWDMKGDDWCRIDGPLRWMRGDHLVVVREIAGKASAAVVERRFVAGLARSDLPLIEHKLLFCSVPSLEEALYLTAFINSTPAQDFLSSFANTTGISPKAIRTLPIPPFDPERADVTTLVSAGVRILHAAPSVRDTVMDEVITGCDEAVVRLAEMDPETYRPQKRRRRMPRAEVDSEAVPMF